MDVTLKNNCLPDGERPSSLLSSVALCDQNTVFTQAVRTPLTVVTQGMLKSRNSNVHAAMDIHRHFKVTE